MDRPSLLIATPVYDGVSPFYVRSLLATQTLLLGHGINVQWVFLAGDSLVSRARNLIAAHCLAHAAATHILWVDGDIRWQPEDVLRLLAYDVDFVCGLCPLKILPAAGSGARFAFRPLESDDGMVSLEVSFEGNTGLFEIKSAGTGFMMTKRVVYERMIEAYPETKISESRTTEQECPATLSWLHNFFPVEVVDGLLLSEDYGFCRRWRQLGGKVWADPGIQLTHHGAHAYTGNPMSMFELPSEVAA